MRILLKACRRCGGDLFPSTDGDNMTFSCLQCGRSLGLLRGAQKATLPTQRREEPLPAA